MAAAVPLPTPVHPHAVGKTLPSIIPYILYAVHPHACVGGGVLRRRLLEQVAGLGPVQRAEHPSDTVLPLAEAIVRERSQGVHLIQRHRGSTKSTHSTICTLQYIRSFCIP